jgi:hypothetical protein
MILTTAPTLSGKRSHHIRVRRVIAGSEVARKHVVASRPARSRLG